MKAKKTIKRVTREKVRCGTIEIKENKFVSFFKNLFKKK